MEKMTLKNGTILLENIALILIDIITDYYLKLYLRPEKSFFIYRIPTLSSLCFCWH